MVQLHEAADQLKEVGVTPVGISYDKVAVLKEFSDAKEIGFPLLSDEGSKVIHAYDLHYQRGLPQPATLLIDKEGKVRAKLFREGYRKRHTVDDLVKAAKELKGE